MNIGSAAATAEGIVAARAFLAEVTRKGELLRQERLKLPQVESVRGRGLMLALALNVQAKPLLELLEQHGLLALNAGEKVVRFLPPLNIGEEQVQEACAIIRKACAELAAASL